MTINPQIKRRAVIKIRRTDTLKVKPEVEALDGMTINVTYGWHFEDHDTSIYRGEVAWMINEPNFPLGWIASGDLQFQEIELTNAAQDN